MLIPGKNQGKRDQVKNFPTRGWGGHLFPQENSNIIRGGRRLGKDSHIKGELPKVVLADDSRCQIRVLQRGSSESGLSLGGSLHNLLIFDSMVIVMVATMVVIKMQIGPGSISDILLGNLMVIVVDSDDKLIMLLLDVDDIDIDTCQEDIDDFHDPPREGSVSLSDDTTFPATNVVLDKVKEKSTHYSL